MKSRSRLIVAAVGVNLVLALGGWFVFVSPQRSHASTAAQQLQRIRDEITSATAAQSQQQQPVIHTADLYRLAQAMPLSADEPDLMLGLDELARASGVKVTGISPGTPAAAVGGYTQLPVTLDLTGSYGSLTAYLHKLRMLVSVRGGSLAAFGRLVSVTDVVLTPADAGKQETASVSLDAFVYGTVAGATPLPAATTSTSTTTTGG